MDESDMELVREYASGRSERAFAELVARHVDLVHSVAMRRVRDPHLAQEVTQAVFIILARKARSLGCGTILPAWLCRTARYVAADALKQQRRRREREQEAYMISQLHDTESADWRQIAPLLDAGMQQLGGREHDAVVLRFLKGRSFGEVAAALGTSEAAAKMRVNRALGRLRKFFAGRGVVLSTSAIAAATMAGSVQTAPAALATSAAAAVSTHGTASGGAALLLANAALKTMTWAKIKTSLVAGAALLMTAGAVTTVFHPARPDLSKLLTDAPGALPVGSAAIPFTAAELAKIPGVDAQRTTITFPEEGHISLRSLVDPQRPMDWQLTKRPTASVELLTYVSRDGKSLNFLAATPGVNVSGRIPIDAAKAKFWRGEMRKGVGGRDIFVLEAAGSPEGKGDAVLLVLQDTTYETAAVPYGPVDLTADDTKMDGGIAIATGNASLKFRGVKLDADRIEYDIDKHQARFFMREGDSFRPVATFSGY